MGHVARRKFVPIVAAGVVAALLSSVRVPYFAEGPGPTEEVAPLLKVDGPTEYPSEGTFLITTVSQSNDRLTVGELLRT